MKKRLLLIALTCAVIMTAWLLTSCQNGNTPEGSGDGQEETANLLEYDLSQYTIVRPENLSKALLDATLNFRKQINQSMGTEIGIKEDWVKGNVITDEIAAQYEILVGATNRPESAKALEGVDNYTSFVITVLGNKIVINAGTEVAVQKGLTYFLSLCETGLSGHTLKLAEDYRYISEAAPAMELVEDGQSDFKIIFRDSCDNTKNADKANEGYDLEVSYTREIKTQIDKLTGSNMRIGTDWAKPGSDTSDLKEVLIGDTARPETAEFLSTLAYNEYGFGVVGNKIVVAGWNLTTLEKAKNLFMDYLRTAVTKSGEDKKSIILHPETRETARLDGEWFLDFPAYEGGTVKGTQDAGFNQLQIYITDTSADEYRAYCDKLAANGYQLYSDNEITGNLFAAYVGEQGMVYVYFVPYEKAVRIVTCPKGKYELPPCVRAEDVPAYTKITETKITQMNLNYAAGNFGMCYVITLEDGSFVIFDGGGYNVSYGDDTRLFKLLQELNVRPDGKIVIAGWFLTHEHWDHFTNFCNMVEAHTKDIIIEACYINTASKNFVANSNNPNYYVARLTPLLRMTGNGKLVKLHTGMKIFIRNVEFEILFTQEDVFPDTCDYFNETTMISRMTAAGQTVMWLGDAKIWGSNGLINRYGSYIRSDICQVAHHGYDGILEKTYVVINPKVALWPTSQANWNTQTSGRTDSYFAVDLFLKNKLGKDAIIVAEPTKTITLPYKVGDPIVVQKN